MRRMPPTLPEFLVVYGLLYAAFGVQSPLLRERGLHTQKRSGSSSVLPQRCALSPVPIGHAADRPHRHTSILCGRSRFKLSGWRESISNLRENTY